MDVPFTMAQVESSLKILGGFSVIWGSIFVVLQLRLNAKQAKARSAFDLLGKIIDPTFPKRRHLLYEVATKRSGGDWTGFDRSLEDFEIRGFANIYEQLGLLVQKKVVDLEDVMNALSAQPLADWHTFQPIRTRIMEEAAKRFPALATNLPGTELVYWPHFEWLAEECGKWIKRRTAG